MKIIMYLEDSAYLNHHTVEKLNEKLQTEDYKVKGFHRIDQANNYIEDILSGKLTDIQICCIITDLNMDQQWLEEYQTETDGGKFSGWVWLKHYIFNNAYLSECHTIIYSGYVKDLNEYLKGDTELLKRNIATISKGGNDNEGLISLYKEIKNKLSI